MDWLAHRVVEGEKVRPGNAARPFDRSAAQNTVDAPLQRDLPAEAGPPVLFCTENYSA